MTDLETIKAMLDKASVEYREIITPSGVVTCLMVYKLVAIEICFDANGSLTNVDGYN